MKHETILKWM